MQELITETREKREIRQKTTSDVNEIFHRTLPQIEQKRTSQVNDYRFEERAKPNSTIK